MNKKITVLILTILFSCIFTYAEVPLKERLTMYKTIMSTKELAETDSAKALMDRILPDNDKLLSAFDANELADRYLSAWTVYDNMKKNKKISAQDEIVLKVFFKQIEYAANYLHDNE